MSGKSQQQNADSSNLESFNISSVSSCGSDKESFKSKYQEQCEKTQKLTEKLAGYKTVVQQLPKFQEKIAQLQKTESDKEKTIEHLRQETAKLLEEKTSKEKELEVLRRQLQPQQKEGQGLTELALEGSRRSSTPTTGSSQSFVIIGKPSSPNRDEGSSPLQKTISESDAQNLRQEHHTSRSLPQHPVNQNVVLQPTQRQFLQNGQPSLHVSPQEVPHVSLTHETKVVTNTSNVSKPCDIYPWGIVKGPDSPPAYNQHSIHTPRGKQPVSYPTAAGGPVSVLVFGSGGRKAARLMEPGTEVKTAEPGPVAAAANTTPSASSVQTPHTSEHDKIPSSVTSQALPTAPFDPTLDEFQGGGARPKEWKPLNTPMMTSDPNSLMEPGASQMWEQPSVSGGLPVVTHGDKASMWSEPRSSFNNLTEDTRMNSTRTQALVDVTPTTGDLMKFPSLGSGPPTPHKQQNIAYPSDEQSHLASQAESMAAILKENKSSTGMSEMLFKFAKEAKDMEAKLQESQALIQRLQVRIQSYAKHSQTEELQRLREEVTSLKEENGTLLEFINTQREGFEVEPGWKSVINNQSTTDPVRAHYPNSPIMKKVETLEKINAKLFLANKDWHNKWEVLRQQHQAEKEELESSVASITSEMEKQREEIAMLDKQLQEANASKQEYSKKFFGLEEEKLQLSRAVEDLKSQKLDMSRSLRRLESEVKTLKGSSQSQGRPHVASKDLETERNLLKQQVAIFAEDFEKERQDRGVAETKVEKMRMERDQIKQSLEAKLRKLNSQLKAQENDLRTKSRQNAELHYQIEDLKLKLQREQRKATFAAQHTFSIDPLPSTIQGPKSHVAYPSGGNRYRRNPTYASQHNQPSITNPSTRWTAGQNISPEYLPGAWQCRHCTYINFPNRTVCDICGYQNTNENTSMTNESASGRQELHSRGDAARRINNSVGDVVVDTL